MLWSYQSLVWEPGGTKSGWCAVIFIFYESLCFLYDNVVNKNPFFVAEQAGLFSLSPLTPPISWPSSVQFGLKNKNTNKLTCRHVNYFHFFIWILCYCYLMIYEWMKTSKFDSKSFSLCFLDWFWKWEKEIQIMLHDCEHLREKSQAMEYLQDLIVYLLIRFSTPLWSTLISGAFVLISLSLSFYLLFEHLSAYKNPEVTARLLVSLSCPSQSYIATGSIIHQGR